MNRSSTATTRGALDATQAAVLAALAPGGTLTVAALTRSAALTSRRTRDAVSKLSARGLIRRGYQARYEITERGRALAPICHA